MNNMALNDSQLIGLLIVAPVLCGLLALLAPAGRPRSAMVILGVISTIGAGILAAMRGACDYTLPAWGGVTSSILEIGIILVIILIGIRIRSGGILLLGLLQLGMGIAEEILTRKHAATAPMVDFRLDTLSLILVLVITMVGSLIVLYAIGYMKQHQDHAPITAAGTGRFFLFMVGFLGIMNGLVLANNLRWLSIFWEITTLCSFMLIGHDGTKEAKANAKRALLINSIGGAAMILASLIGAATGKGESLDGLMASQAVIPVAFLFLAALTKSAQLPFQSWLLGAMVAPTPVSALLHSATMVKAGSYLIIRLSPAFAGERIMDILAIAGALTFVMGSALAISQSNAKKVLAYSTIANLGLIAACASINSPLGYATAIMLLCFHALSKGLLFLCVGTIEQGIGSRDIEDMGGIMYRMPMTAGISLLGMAAMLVPPSGMLVCKWMAIESAIHSPLMLLLVVLGSAMTVLFWAKWLGRIQTVSFHQKYKLEKLSPTISIAMIILVTGVLVTAFTVMPLYNRIFLPMANKVFAGLGQEAHAINLSISAGMLAVWPILAALGLALLLSLLIWRPSDGKRVSLPFMCGENVVAERLTYRFYSAKDEPDTAWAATMYFGAHLNESRLTFWGNLFALLVILTMFSMIGGA